MKRVIMIRAYVIRIPKYEDCVRAIGAFLSVPETRHRFPGNVMLVTQGHIDALKREGIPYEDLTDVPSQQNGKKPRKTKSRRSS
jgi:hypothetical protein